MAVHLGKYFYDALVEGHRGAQALHKAAGAVLRGMCNPVGMLYTYTGNPDLRVDNPGVQVGDVQMAISEGIGG